MKFCKNLQKVVDISDPEWAPFWLNYKVLKKLIKELPTLVPSEDANKQSRMIRTRAVSTEGCQVEDSTAESGLRRESSASRASANSTEQQQGDETSEDKGASGVARARHAAAVAAASAAALDENAQEQQARNDLSTIGKSPGEIAFFKVLHAEFKKATHFFERAQQEYLIREDRVSEGMKIMKQPNSIMVGEKWSLLAKSIYRLYKDLLLLETFAIMTYCGFSKILKKHDKVTGYHTRQAFMANIVNRANFTSYPKVLGMMSRCEQLYEEVSNWLVQDGKHDLYEDERLFINMIHRLNEQVIEGVNEEGTPGRKETRRQSMDLPTVAHTSKESWATSSLRQLVKENEASRLNGQVSAGCDSDADEDDRKPEATTQQKTEITDNDGRKRIADSDVLENKRKRAKS